MRPPGGLPQLNSIPRPTNPVTHKVVGPLIEGKDPQDQLAEKAFLRGYRNSRIAYDALNRAPWTLNDALELVTPHTIIKLHLVGIMINKRERERERERERARRER